MGWWWGWILVRWCIVQFGGTHEEYATYFDNRTNTGKGKIQFFWDTSAQTYGWIVFYQPQMFFSVWCLVWSIDTWLSCSGKWENWWKPEILAKTVISPFNIFILTLYIICKLLSNNPKCKNPEEASFWKHCGKRRTRENASVQIFLSFYHKSQS